MNHLFQHYRVLTFDDTWPILEEHENIQINLKANSKGVKRLKGEHTFNHIVVFANQQSISLLQKEEKGYKNTNDTSILLLDSPSISCLDVLDASLDTFNLEHCLIYECSLRIMKSPKCLGFPFSLRRLHLLMPHLEQSLESLVNLEVLELSLYYLDVDLHLESMKQLKEYRVWVMREFHPHGILPSSLKEIEWYSEKNIVFTSYLKWNECVNLERLIISAQSTWYIMSNFPTLPPHPPKHLLHLAACHTLELESGEPHVFSIPSSISNIVLSPDILSRNIKSIHQIRLTISGKVWTGISRILRDPSTLLQHVRYIYIEDFKERHSLPISMLSAACENLYLYSAGKLHHLPQTLKSVRWIKEKKTNIPKHFLQSRPSHVEEQKTERGIEVIVRWK